MASVAACRRVSHGNEKGKLHHNDLCNGIIKGRGCLSQMLIEKVKHPLDIQGRLEPAIAMLKAIK